MSINFRATLIHFWNNVNKTNSCWHWQGAISDQGYGLITIDEETEYAHRVSWLIHNGLIKGISCILHKPLICHNRLCVNPNHLYEGTKKENARDMKIDGTFFIPVNQGEKNHFSKLTKNDVINIRDNYTSGQYTCKQLAKEYSVSRGCIFYIINHKTWKHI